MQLPNESAKGGKKKDPFPGRGEWERRLTRKLGGKFDAQLKELLDLLGDPPRFENVPEEFWARCSSELRRVIEDTMTDILLEHANEFLEVAPIGGVDWTQINENAAQWARQYSYELVKEITDGQRDKTREEIARYYEDGHLTIDDVARALEGQYSRQRAESIAVTETTRAAVEGERGIVHAIEGYGIRMRGVWRTANDDVTCEVCGSKDGEEIEGDDFPPAHPNCRCGVSWEVVE